MLKIFSKNTQRGFTLIELMIVIAIIGILAAIAIPQFIAYRQKGYNTQAKAELKGFYTACQGYVVEHPIVSSCDFSMISSSFTKSNAIDINITGGITLVGTTAAHDAGTSTYSVGIGGIISP